MYAAVMLEMEIKTVLPAMEHHFMSKLNSQLGRGAFLDFPEKWV